MKRAFIIAAMLLCAAGMISCGSYTSLQPPKKPTPENSAMTVGDVIDLSKANTSDEVIIAQIQAKHAVFALSNQDIIELKNAGVSEQIIEAMIKTNAVAKNDSAVVHYWYPRDYWWYAGYYRPGYYYGYPRSYWGASFYWRPYYYGRPRSGGSVSGGSAPIVRRSVRRR